MTSYRDSLRPRARYAALLILLPLLAGCSAAANSDHASGSAAKASPSASSSAASSAGSSANLGPCDYLSAADASTIFGTTLTSSEAAGACSYSGSGAVGFATTVNRGIKGPNDPTWKNEVETLDGATKLSGVGDEAYGGAGSVEVKVIVLSGDAIIEVADADGSDSTTFPRSIAIAKAIIAKLG